MAPLNSEQIIIIGGKLFPELAKCRRIPNINQMLSDVKIFNVSSLTYEMSFLNFNLAPLLVPEYLPCIPLKKGVVATADIFSQQVWKYVAVKTNSSIKVEVAKKMQFVRKGRRKREGYFYWHL